MIKSRFSRCGLKPSCSPADCSISPSPAVRSPQLLPSPAVVPIPSSMPSLGSPTSSRTAWPSWPSSLRARPLTSQEPKRVAWPGKKLGETMLWTPWTAQGYSLQIRDEWSEFHVNEKRLHCTSLRQLLRMWVGLTPGWNKNTSLSSWIDCCKKLDGSKFQERGL